MMTAPARTRRATRASSWYPRARRIQGGDLLAYDHLPACPDCGDLAHPTATVCEACGAHLFPKKSNAPDRTSIPWCAAQGVNRKEA